MGELATIVKYNLPVKIVLFKNNTLGEIKWEQLVLEGNPQFGVELQPIDFAAYARACGAGGFSVDTPGQVADVLREAFAYPGPALVEATIDPNEPPMPGKVTLAQALRFAEALARGERDRADIIKTVIEDRVREVI
jgi:pyruvate dehydrogenase (quinone)